MLLGYLATAPYPWYRIVYYADATFNANFSAIEFTRRAVLSSRTEELMIGLEKIWHNFRLCLIGVAGLSFAAGQGAAETLFTYPDFSSTAGLTLVGNASTASTSDGTVLRVTPATGGQSGAAYSTTAVPLGSGNSFSTAFQFRFTNPGGIDPADGIVFVIGTSTTGLGTGGFGIGYAGVSGNSIGIEFDTYNNGGSDGNSSNEVGIDTNGGLQDSNLAKAYGVGTCDFGGSPATYKSAGCMSNGNLWTVNMSYNGSALTVSLSDPAEGTSFTALNAVPLNLASILGQNTAFVGFSSGTGAGWENHDIVNWTFSNSATPTPTPEPGTVVLVGGGLLVVALVRKRRTVRTA